MAALLLVLAFAAAVGIMTYMTRDGHMAPRRRFGAGRVPADNGAVSPDWQSGMDGSSAGHGHGHGSHHTPALGHSSGHGASGEWDSGHHHTAHDYGSPSDGGGHHGSHDSGSWSDSGSGGDFGGGHHH